MKIVSATKPTRPLFSSDRSVHFLTLRTLAKLSLDGSVQLWPRVKSARHRRNGPFSAVHGFESPRSFLAILTGIGSRKMYKSFGGAPNPLPFYRKLRPFSAAHSFTRPHFDGPLHASARDIGSRRKRLQVVSRYCGLTDRYIF